MSTRKKQKNDVNAGTASTLIPRIVGWPELDLETSLRWLEKLAGAHRESALPVAYLPEVLRLAPKSPALRRAVRALLAYDLIEASPDNAQIRVSGPGRSLLDPTNEEDYRQLLVGTVLRPPGMLDLVDDLRNAPISKQLTIALRFTNRLGLAKERATTVAAVAVKNLRQAGLIRPRRGEPAGGGMRTRAGSQGARARPRNSNASMSAGAATSRRDSDGTNVSRKANKKNRKPTVATRAKVAPDEPAQSLFLSRGVAVDCYRLTRRLGAGFSAEVWEATVDRVPPGSSLTEGQIVAVKFFHSHAMALPDQVLRVEREYRVAQLIRHKNLIRIHEFMLASPRPNHSFLVMDVARGVSLGKAIENGQVQPKVALTIFMQVLEALDALHSNGALHRDVKPNNISVELLQRSTHATLLDLGIVSVTYERGITALSRFLGSKHWAPIEQLMGDGLDARSDLYSAAAVAFHSLTGIEPYAGSRTEAAVALAMSKGSLNLPSDLKIPTAVRDLIEACLSPVRSNRPSSAEECLRILRGSIRR